MKDQKNIQICPRCHGSLKRKAFCRRCGIVTCQRVHCAVEVIQDIQITPEPVKKLWICLWCRNKGTEEMIRNMSF